MDLVLGPLANFYIILHTRLKFLTLSLQMFEERVVELKQYFHLGSPLNSYYNKNFRNWNDEPEIVDSISHHCSLSPWNLGRWSWILETD